MSTLPCTTIQGWQVQQCKTEGKLLAAHITELVSIQEANVGIPEIPLSRKEVIQTAEMIKS